MNISRGKVAKAQKVCVYGPEGVGKSTFASQFPNPVFIDVEDSTLNMDVFRFDKPTSIQMVYMILDGVIANPGEIKTIVIDTADWTERLIKEKIIMSGGQNIKSIEDFGYGKGFTMLAEEFGRLLNRCSDVVERGVNVVFTAHAAMRKQELPDEMGAFDRWELKLEKKVAPLLKEWADLLLFANYKTYVIEDSKTKTKKATGGQMRVMYTTHSATRDAKNRHGLPDELPFEFSSIAHIFTPMSNSKQEEVKPAEEPKQVVNEPVKEEPKQEPVVAEKATTETPTDIKNETSQNLTYPDCVPKKLQDILRNEGVKIEEIMEIFEKGGSYPKETPIENVAQEAWDYVVANWNIFKNQLTNLNI